MSYKKGKETRRSILSKAIDIFNNKGIALTIDGLAKEIGLTKSRITNHFPTRESLFQAIMEDYQQKFRRHLIAANATAGKPGFQTLAALLNEIMDIQYHYRSGIAYATIITPFQIEISAIRSSFNADVENIKHRIQKMVDAGLVAPEILKSENFKVFIFQYTTLLTTWVIPLIIYEQNAGYPAIKPLYLRSFLECYRPYLTEAGLKDFAAIDFPKFNTVCWQDDQTEEV